MGGFRTHQPRLAEANLDIPVICFTLIVGAVSALLFSVAPMFGSRRGSVHDTLKESGRGGTGGIQRERMRSVLVAAEFAFAALLLAGAGLLLKTFKRGRRRAPEEPR